MPTPDNYWVRPDHVAIGVMSYNGAFGDRNLGAGVREWYLESMTRLVTRLVDDGRTATLIHRGCSMTSRSRLSGIQSGRLGESSDRTP